MPVPSLDLQTVRSESAEALTCLVEKILRHGDVNERRMDIAVPEIGREERMCCKFDGVGW
jgi:hypothetical protein